ncbi:conserved hypothetical protein [Candidatus Nitrotoga sp. HW29]|uniref:type IV pilus assembly protein FimV n=1 Tax=Candidatus Nitrotoga sp. HW29 TaxID=2886963 RepID=UPI001EF1EB76|nr:hypothetical protein [Candidatus Nitrotoga sp. HW29]CAH1906039.1 conserved hypothetical protein [Candidatus Nitrotoga sp. HW29]
MLQMGINISCYTRRALSLAIIFASLSTQLAHALIIGEIESISREGEPLLAYVQIFPSNPDEKITTSCFSLVKVGQAEPDLPAASLELEGDRNIGQRIKISTATPINTRLLTLPLKAHCIPHGLIIREFNLELKPAPNTLFPQAESVSTQAEKVDVSFLQKPELSGSIRAGYFSSSRKLDGKNDLGTSSIWLKATQNIGENVSVVAQGWIRNDETFRADADSKKLQEGYIKFSTENVDYRIGRQIIVWGRADRLNPTDNLTPRNFTLLTAEEDDQRLGSLAAKITYHSHENSLTAIWLPGMDPHIFPVATTPGIFFTQHIPHTNRIALKFDHSGGNVDWSASYYSGLDLTPDIAIGATTLSGTNIIFDHNRIHVLGMDAATVIGRYGLRAEAAYTWTANTGENDFLVKKPFLYMVMGGDRTFLDYLNINIQYYLRHVTNYSDPQAITDPLLRPVAIQTGALWNQFSRSQHGVSIRISNKWFNETLEGEIAAVGSFGQSNYFIRPKLVYAFSDNVKGSLGLDIYRGDNNTFFGRLRDNSLLFAEMKYGF